MSAIESSREDIIGEPVARMLRLNAFAILAHLFLLVRHCTLLWNRAPQKDALFHAQMRYFRRESEMWL